MPRTLLRRVGQLCDTLPTGLRRRRTARRLGGHDIHHAELGSCQIRYRSRAGTGPSVVFAADPPVPVELYGELFECLDRQISATVFEVPGFNGSLPGPGHSFSFPNAVGTVERFLEALPGGPHVLVFPCVVGYLGVTLSLRRPDLVAGLVAPQMPDWAAGLAWKRGRDPQGLLGRPVLGQLALAAMKRRRIRQWYASALGGAARLDTFVAATVENFDGGGCFCLASGFQDFLTDHHGLLAPMDRPALSVWGGLDASHRRTEPACALNLLPRAELVTWDDSGHFPELEQPERFAIALNGYLETLAVNA
ncbi:MAG: alpha/beta hydrolase [Pseudomonadota bacterium]